MRGVSAPTWTPGACGVAPWTGTGGPRSTGTTLAAPSAGALYPFETHVSAQAVHGTEPCLTHLHLPIFRLAMRQEGHLGRHVAQAALGQEFLARAAAVFLWTAILRRCARKYGDRALRHLGVDEEDELAYYLAAVGPLEPSDDAV